MYGLVIEGVKYMIAQNFGEAVLTQALTLADIHDKEISTHDQYGEHIVPNLFKALCEITDHNVDQIGILAGRFFVRFLICHGYGDLMNVMGRKFSDFLKGLDNIHEYFRFSYPKIKPPSFYCSMENENGLILHYRSRRRGYIAYVMGQLIELARCFYNIELGAKVVKLREKGRFTFVTIKLLFDNTAVGADMKLRERVQNLNEFLPVDTISFLKMFPFYLAFDKQLEIISAGEAILNLMPLLIGQKMPDVFDLQRPCIKFTAEGCLSHENCNFQLESLSPVFRRENKAITLKINDVTADHVGVEQKERPPSPSGPLNYVILRGPIVFLKHCDTFLLLATCVVEDLDAMFRMGLFLNDYGDSDCNREIIMASIQKSDHLKTLLAEEKKRSQVLTEMTREIKCAKRKARALLVQMMPFEVASMMLRTGKSDHCQAFDSVTIAFIKICNFIEISADITAADTVNLLNHIFSLFDELVDLHGCYKVETIGESYMVSSGVPYPNDHDAEVIADICLHMLSKMRQIELRAGDRLVRVKIGSYSGAVVGGVVGHRTPRYCLFGDTVNCASRMESHNKTPMSIQIGQSTKDKLDRQTNRAFKIKSRGLILFKGKGEMPAYEVVGKGGRARYIKHPPLTHEDEPSSGTTTGREEVQSEDPSHATALSRMDMSESESRCSSPNGSARSDNASISSLNKVLALDSSILPIGPLRPLEPVKVNLQDVEERIKDLKGREKGKGPIKKTAEIEKAEALLSKSNKSSKSGNLSKPPSDNGSLSPPVISRRPSSPHSKVSVPSLHQSSEILSPEVSKDKRMDEEPANGTNGGPVFNFEGPSPVAQGESPLLPLHSLPEAEIPDQKLSGCDSEASLRNTLPDVSNNHPIGQIPEEASLPGTDIVKDSIHNYTDDEDIDYGFAAPMIPRKNGKDKVKKTKEQKAKEKKDKKESGGGSRSATWGRAPRGGDTPGESGGGQCKCEEIRRDPRLKTKVCSLM